MSQWNEARANNELVIFLHAVLHRPLVCVIGLLCGTEPIRSVTIPVSKYERRKLGSSWEYGAAWHQLRNLHKSLDRWGWGDYWCFLTLYLCWSYSPIVLLWTQAQSDSIRCKADWLPGLKYILTCGSTLIRQPLGLRTSDNNNNNNNNNNRENNHNNIKIVIMIIKIMHNKGRISLSQTYLILEVMKSR